MAVVAVPLFILYLVRFCSSKSLCKYSYSTYKNVNLTVCMQAKPGMRAWKSAGIEHELEYCFTVSSHQYIRSRLALSIQNNRMLTFHISQCVDC